MKKYAIIQSNAITAHGLTLAGADWSDAGAPTLGSVTDIELWSDDGVTVKAAVPWSAA